MQQENLLLTMRLVILQLRSSIVATRLKAASILHTFFEETLILRLQLHADPGPLAIYSFVVTNLAIPTRCLFPSRWRVIKWELP